MLNIKLKGISNDLADIAKIIEISPNHHRFELDDGLFIETFCDVKEESFYTNGIVSIKDNTIIIAPYKAQY